MAAKIYNELPITIRNEQKGLKTRNSCLAFFYSLNRINSEDDGGKVYPEININLCNNLNVLRAQAPA